MNKPGAPLPGPDALTDADSSARAELERPWRVLRWLLVTATTWYLLRELAPILRPLLLAVFLAYVILPVHLYVKGHVHGGIGRLGLLVAVGVVLAGLGALTYGDVIALARELPRLHARAKAMLVDASDYTRSHVPALEGMVAGTASAEEQGSSRIQELLQGFATITAGVLAEAIQVVFYLALILVEARRLPQRMRAVFAEEQADNLLSTIASINAAIAGYLKVKVKANIVLTVPVMLVLGTCGFRFVVLWGAITFFANFVPYLGSIVACSLPLLFGFLDIGFTGSTIAAAVFLPAVHVLSAYVVEPAMTGKAVDLSPLVVLIALSFWGLCWGLTGMILAVPLTAMLRIVLERAPSTRPIAGLMGGE